MLFLKLKINVNKFIIETYSYENTLYAINQLQNYFNNINKWPIIVWKNLQEVSDMLATLFLILRKSHFWLTSILLILFL